MAVRDGKRENERGAMLVHVALAILALMAFSAFSIDYGVFWLSRRQAQNSADAGALAGAIALAFENPGQADGDPAKQGAFAATQRNLVFGDAADAKLAASALTALGACGRLCWRADWRRRCARD